MHSLRFSATPRSPERLSYPQLIEALRIGLAKPCSAPLSSCRALLRRRPQGYRCRCGRPVRIGVKLVTVFPGNGARGLPAVAAVFALFDGR